MGPFLLLSRPPKVVLALQTSVAHNDNIRTRDMREPEQQQRAMESFRHKVKGSLYSFKYRFGHDHLWPPLERRVSLTVQFTPWQ